MARLQNFSPITGLELNFAQITYTHPRVPYTESLFQRKLYSSHIQGMIITKSEPKKKQFLHISWRKKDFENRFQISEIGCSHIIHVKSQVK